MVDTTNRDRGLELLDLTARYDIPTVRESHREILLAGIIIRSRRLLRAAYTLADQDMLLEAQVLLRVLTEYGITLAWLGIDLELGTRVAAAAAARPRPCQRSRRRQRIVPDGGLHHRLTRPARVVELRAHRARVGVVAYLDSAISQDVVLAAADEQRVV